MNLLCFSTCVGLADRHSCNKTELAPCPCPRKAGRGFSWAAAALALLVGVPVCAAQELVQTTVSLGTKSFVNSRRVGGLGGNTNDPRVRMQGEWVNPKTAKSTAKAPADSLRMVQLSGGLDAAASQALADAHLRVVGFMPDNLYIVAASPSKKKAAKALPSTIWVGDYDPAYRLSSELQDAVNGLNDANSLINVKAAFLRELDLQGCVAGVSALGELQSTETTLSEQVVEVTLRASRLNDLAGLPGVVVVEYAPLDTFHSNVARGIIGVPALWSNRSLYGEGEIIAVADSGIDKGSLTDIHADFEDGAGGSRLLWTQDFSGDGVNDNGSGHGTHVAGIALGNGFLSGSDPTNNYFPDTCYAGVAPKASFVFQALGRSNDTGGTTVYLPTNSAGLYELFDGAYTNGARIHQDSWGSAVSGRYDARSREVDQWNYEHPDMLICFSAQNSGRDSSPRNGVVDSNSMQRPATCKNVLTVGASESYRPTITNTYRWYSSSLFASNPIQDSLMADETNGMAAMSSRGWCSDGRIKPDLVAPGTWIVSTRTHDKNSTNLVLWGTLPGNTNYCYGGGASMATPVVSGAAALMREYLRTQCGVTNPSAPLLKALLINGAVDLSPGQYGTDAFREIQEAPNTVEGWGRVQLEDGLFGLSNRVVHFEDGARNPIMGMGTTGTTFTVVDTNLPVKVHLTWLDIAASRHTVNWAYSAIVGGGMVNDLDLRITGPGGEEYLPRARDPRVNLYYYTNNDTVAYYEGASGLNLYIAQQCTAPELPLNIDHIFYMIQDTAGQSATNTFYIWAGGDSSNDPPGAVLASSNAVSGGAIGLLYYAVPMTNASLPTLAITSRYFYVGCRQTSTNVCLIFDPTSTSSRAYATFDTNNWAAGRGLNGNFWIHAMGRAQTNDHVNTVEGIIITNPAAGEYQVEINAVNMPYAPVRYGLVMSGGLGGGTLVTLYDFYLREENGHMTVCWETASEEQTVGFDLFRWTDGAWVKVNDSLIYGSGSLGGSYRVVDPVANATDVFRYKLVEYETDGGVEEYGPFDESIRNPRLENLSAIPGGILLRWLSREQDTYEIQKSLDVRNGFFPLATRLPATPPVNVYTDQTETVNGAYYRVRVE